MGHGFALRLREQRFNVEMVNVGSACEKTDETTIGQLAGIWFEIDSRGRLMIESKERARARGVLSFDRAEALMLALGKPQTPWKLEITTPRDLRRTRSESARDLSHPYWGFDDLGDDDGDDGRVTMSPPSRWDLCAPGSLARYFRRNPGAY